jgi:hypothetical protein
MNAPGAAPPPLPDPAPALSPERVLRRLFLTLFLRGRGARGLRKQSAPKSVGSKLASTLAIYALFGAMAMMFIGQPVFVLSVYLHAMTLMFLGMYVATSAGEVLFNKEEADILMHRPITPRVLLWAKIGVLVQVSLWLAGAFNLAGLFIGVAARDGGWLFPVAHLISTVQAALFCTGCVVLVYQLCLRWFGRERLDGLMTTAQVLMAVAVILASQMVPHLMGRFAGRIHFNLDAWWVWLLPPAWFAGFDDVMAGRAAPVSWALGGLGLLATGAVLWSAFGKLAGDYETGLRMLNESKAAPLGLRGGRRWLDRLINTPPIRWWLKDPVTRATFLLTAAYLARDRDVKLRIYPGLAPMLVMPLIFLIRDHGRESGSFGVAFAGTYLGLVPLLGLNLLQYSQHWQAADVFRTAPLPGPAPLCHGARRAILALLTVPVLLFYALVVWLAGIELSRLALLLPGLIALPIFALIPSLTGKTVPLSLPIDEAKSAGRGLHMIGVMLISTALSGLAMWSWSGGWFLGLLLVEVIAAFGLYEILRRSIDSTRWTSLE